MEDIMDSVRRVLANWTTTRVPIISDVSAGDSVVNVRNTQRFRAGDEIMFWNGSTGKGETPLYVTHIVSNTQLRVTPAVRFSWSVSDQVMVRKCFNSQFVQRIYVGDPDNIPKLPAIAVVPVNKQSSWLTIESTKEVYNLKIIVYTEDAHQEEALRVNMRILKAAEHGLKNNISPLVSPYETSTLIADVAEGDLFIKVADTSVFQGGTRIYLEDDFQDDEISLKSVVDSTTLELYGATCAFSRDVTKVINVHRHVFNSWPEAVSFGDVFKGTLMKAASITWFCWEEELHNTPLNDRMLG